MGDITLQGTNLKLNKTISSTSPLSAINIANKKNVSQYGCAQSVHKDSIILPQDWVLTDRQLCDLEMLLNKSFYPLEGYLCKNDYENVVINMRLCNNCIFPIPIVFALPQNATTSNVHWCRKAGKSEDEEENSDEEELVDSFDEEEENLCNNISNRLNVGGNKRKIIRLRDHLGVVIAELHVDDIYIPDIEKEILYVLGSSDPNHPYAKYMRENYKNCYYIGGKVYERNAIKHFDYIENRLSPSDVNLQIIQKNDWGEGKVNIIGFQTRNPMHRSHFELTVNAIKETEKKTNKKTHLLLTPTVGITQPGDIDYRIRIKCYKQILKYYKDVCDVHIVLIPIAMRMAGPREAVWHSIIRKNFGCTHFIVGRDHAGPSCKKTNGESFYKPYDAHILLQSVKEEIGIEPVFGKEMAFVGDAFGGYVEADKIPLGAVPQNISGTSLRNMLQNREVIPDWFTFCEVSQELQKVFQPKNQIGFCVYFTGLPCSGKSTLASALESLILEKEEEKRKVSLLDADIIRTHLSYGLGFDKNDRSINVRRIGYVASEIVKHNGICIVANIAPYESDREFNRKLVESAGGGYIEVYVSTPLEICEGRDIKQLYKKARQGVIKQFTGISDPYEVPTKCELNVNSSENIQFATFTVFNYLKSKNWI